MFGHQHALHEFLNESHDSLDVLDREVGALGTWHGHGDRTAAMMRATHMLERSPQVHHGRSHDKAHDWIAQGARSADGTPAPMPVGERVRLRGKVTGENEIDGARFTVTGETRLDDVPGIGGKAEMRGEVQPDGSVLATRYRGR